MSATTPIRWAIIGCGDVARRRVAQAINQHPGSILAAVARRNQQKLLEFAAEFNVPRTSRSADELLNDPGIDAVYLATPNHLHAPHTIQAAAAGKHVLVEKPMALNLAECQHMIDACQQHNVKLGVAYYRRFYPIIERIGELIAEDTIGQPLAVSATTAAYFDIPAGADGYWRVDPASGGGGALMDIGSHRLNLFYHLFGKANRVQAVATTLVRDYEAENAASASLQFESGPIGTLQCCFESPVDPDEFTVLGSRGRLTAAPLNGDQLVIQTAAQTWTETLPPNPNFNAPLIADFVEAIEQDRSPRVDGREGYETNRLLQQCYEAARASG